MNQLPGLARLRIGNKKMDRSRESARAHSQRTSESRTHDRRLSISGSDSFIRCL